MLKAQKKITHKELKKDKLVTTYFEGRDWLVQPQNQKKIYMVLGAVAIIVVGIIMYTSNRNAKNEEAELKFAPVVSLYEQGKYNDAIHGDPATNTMGLVQIVNEYGSTNAGQTAKVYLANCFFNIRDFDNALKYFEDYSGKNDILKASALSGVGAVWEAKGDLKKAAEYFEKASKVNKKVIINQENIYYSIRAYSQAGDKDNAKRMYEVLKNDYPKSKYFAEIKKFETAFRN